MMKRISFLFTLIILSRLVFSQSCINQLRKFDFNTTEKIIRDSIWISKDLWKLAGFDNAKEAEKVKFLIIPLCYFKKDLPSGILNKSIINYLEVQSRSISSLVVINDSIIGYISAYKTNIKTNKVIQDSLEDFIISSNNLKICDSIYRWEVNFPETSFKESGERCLFSKNLFEIIKGKQLSTFFTFPYDIMDIWFFEKNNLRAYSIQKMRVVDEKDLIKGIKRVTKNGREHYYLEYREDK
jgi:hypothetical protein